MDRQNREPAEAAGPIVADTLLAAAFMTALYFAFDALAELLIP